MKLILAAASAALFAFPALAQQNCAPRDAVIQQLAEKYGETRQSIGLVANGNVLEVFASRESGSWTITISTPQGLTCLMASGQAFEVLSEELPKPGQEG